MTRFTLPCLSVLLAAAVVAAPVPKAGAPELKWKFTKGDSFYVKHEQETTSGVNQGGAGGAQGATGLAVFVYKFTVVSVAEKETVVEVQFESCKSGNGAGGAAMKLTDEKGVAGKKATLTLDAAYKVTKADAADLVKAAPGAANGMLTEEYFQYIMNDLIQSVPGKAMSKGEKWSGELESPIMQGLTAKRVNRGVVDEVKDGVAKLVIESDHSWAGSPGGGGAGGLTYNLKGENGQTTVWFDTKTGRLQKREETYTLAGGINVGGGGGAPQQITLSVKMKSTVTVSDEKPKDE